MYPRIVYHRTKGAKSVTSEGERLALGDGWHFDLAHCPAVVADVAPETEPVEVPAAIVRRRGRPPKAR